MADEQPQNEEQTDKKVRLPLRAKFSSKRRYLQAGREAGDAARYAQGARWKRYHAGQLRTQADDLEAEADAAEHSAAGREATASRLREAGERIEDAGREYVTEREELRRRNAEARRRMAGRQDALRERTAKRLERQIAGIEQAGADRLQAVTEENERALSEADAVVAAREAELATAKEAYYKAAKAEGEAIAARENIRRENGEKVKQVTSGTAAEITRARREAQDATAELQRRQAGEMGKLKSAHKQAEREQKASLRTRIAQVLG